ncbi:MAG: hypothetical protein WB424_06535 [Terracidiphilus sp.]
MTNSLSILPECERIRTFLCPVCKQTIALGCERCRFCSVVIDQNAAAAAADLMDRVNLACSDAQDIRTICNWHRKAFSFSVEPRQGLAYYLVPFLLARWWMRFGSLQLEDEDLIRAKKDMSKYSWITAVSLAIFVGLVALGFFYNE